MTSRRDFLRNCISALGTGMLCCPPTFAQSRDLVNINLTPKEKILANLPRFSPLHSGNIPKNFSSRFGVAHVEGRYCFTNSPFLLEGCKKIREFGAGAVKLWVDNPATNYSFNSDWSDLPENPPSIDILKHKYFVEAFKYPFSTFALEFTRRPYRQNNNIDFGEYEEEFEEVTAYLYETYAKRNVTFILQNWEGDWLLREGFSEKWDQEMRNTLESRVHCLTEWFSARQRGVEKARKKALSAKPMPRCRVMHAIEVNRVIDIFNHQPTVTELILPKVPADLVSWSSWDGFSDPVNMWHGIELIKHFMKPSGFLKNKTVMIGEVGMCENDLDPTPQAIVNHWDRALSVFNAHNIPLIIHWEIYCNEPKNRELRRIVLSKENMMKESELRGLWLVRPDGSLGIGGRYLKKVLETTVR